MGSKTGQDTDFRLETTGHLRSTAKLVTAGYFSYHKLADKQNFPMES